jgi:hypothetical protein
LFKLRAADGFGMISVGRLVFLSLNQNKKKPTTSFYPIVGLVLDLRDSILARLLARPLTDLAEWLIARPGLNPGDAQAVRALSRSRALDSASNAVTLGTTLPNRASRARKYAAFSAVAAASVV